MTFDIPLNYPNRLPNFHNTYPSFHYEIYEDGPIFVTKREVRLSGGSQLMHREMTSESIDHIMDQILTEYQWQETGYVQRIGG